MRADLAGGIARRVLVWHTDRLHRRNAELESWIGEIAEPYRVTVHSVQAGPIDLATPSGQMVARQLGAVAQYESAIKAERIRAKMEQKADNGEWMGGPVPFGWRRIGTEKGRGRLEIEPDEAELVAGGTRTLLDGASLRDIVREWEASGVKARHGQRTNDHWHRRTVLGILKRWRNAGVHEHRGEPTPDRPADWPAIPEVSVEDVRAIRELLAERAPAHTLTLLAYSIKQPVRVRGGRGGWFWCGPGGGRSSRRYQTCWSHDFVCPAGRGQELRRSWAERRHGRGSHAGSIVEAGAIPGSSAPPPGSRPRTLTRGGASAPSACPSPG